MAHGVQYQALLTRDATENNPEEKEKNKSFIYAVQQFWRDIRFQIFRIGCMFYLDFALDVQTIVIFLSSGKYDFALLNYLAIMASSGYAFTEMRHSRAPKEIEDGALKVYVTAGYLTPFCLHMGYLACVSWYDQKKHRLLECSKLAEATLEASISALVQTYALVHHDIPEKVAYLGLTQETMVLFSVMFSFGTMGYTLMGFDCKEPGLHNLPGTADLLQQGNGKIWVKYVLLLVARTSEVASRITSIALFSVCTRGLIDLDFADEWPQPWKYLVKSFLLTLGPSLVLFDFFIQLLWIHCYREGNETKAFLSVLCCMNPLLERGNPFSVKVEWYYLFRLVELLLMVFAVFFLPEDHQHVREVLASNRLLCIMFLVTTALCGLLLCLLRVQYAHHALLNDDILEEWSRLRDRDFNAAPKALLEDLHKDQFHGQLKLKDAADKAMRCNVGARDTSDGDPVTETRRIQLTDLRRKYTNLQACISDDTKVWLLRELNARWKQEALHPDQLGKLISVLRDLPKEGLLGKLQLSLMLNLGREFWRVRGRADETRDFEQLLCRVRELLEAQTKKDGIYALTPKVKAGRCPKKGHELVPLGSHQQKREWCCDGVNEIGGCLSGIKWGDFDTTKGMNCFCCKQCGFDYCEKCYIRCVKAKVCSKGHVMVALGGAQDLPNWTCDGCGQKHEGSVDRHCCKQCNYNLCDPCNEVQGNMSLLLEMWNNLPDDGMPKLEGQKKSQNQFQLYWNSEGSQPLLKVMAELYSLHIETAIWQDKDLLMLGSVANKALNAGLQKLCDHPLDKIREVAQEVIQKKFDEANRKAKELAAQRSSSDAADLPQAYDKELQETFEQLQGVHAWALQKASLDTMVADMAVLQHHADQAKRERLESEQKNQEAQKQLQEARAGEGRLEQANTELKNEVHHLKMTLASEIQKYRTSIEEHRDFISRQNGYIQSLEEEVQGLRQTGLSRPHEEATLA
ncbi:CTD small phosphatase-like protein 2 [Durusdinium trenchii]|uniref:CTD small phosphatase-like protein 2 n=1 Tax=Durusdinium trenchii TaxID=1381693 RepID=A0ABP0JL32_9DINO